jgi:hypothetical protein
MSSNLCIGIDLGTSNCSIAIANSTDELIPQNVPIVQIADYNSITSANLLPSNIFLLPKEECSNDKYKLPWSDKLTTSVIGSYALERGALNPERMISSAKSWLCVNRKDILLPWGMTQLETRKISPVEASKQLLQHIFLSLKNSVKDIDVDIATIVITVPASFDEVARTLTVDAATQAGIKNFSLLEEPQAAVYDWLSNNSDWRETLKSGDSIFICDVGGGTADFSLIFVVEDQGELSLKRISVGDHILLGGDNMDLALAIYLKNRLNEQDGVKIDDWQFRSLIQLARRAKEVLLSKEDIKIFNLAIPSRGSDIFASSIEVEITKKELEKIIVEGFFPKSDSTDYPKKLRQTGLQELGLPYASEPAFTKHIAYFLNQCNERIKSDESLKELNIDNSNSTLLPTFILFNGGVFNAEVLRERVKLTINSWGNDNYKITELLAEDRDIAVARGACSYAKNKVSGKGFRIRAGTSKGFYLGIESSMPAIPGMKRPLNGLCIVPLGTEEGSEISLQQNEFGLFTGEEVDFRFFSTAVRPNDEAGALVENIDTIDYEILELPSLTLTIPPLSIHEKAIHEKAIHEKAIHEKAIHEKAIHEKGFIQEKKLNQESEIVPVTLSVIVNDIGILELWMQHTKSNMKWKLEFNLRLED